MPLRNLVKHISAQEAAVTKPSLLDSETEACSGWTTFRQQLWGDGGISFLVEGEVDKDDNPIIVVSILPPATRSVVNLPLPIPCLEHTRRNILIWSEYKLRRRLCWSTNPTDAVVLRFYFGSPQHCGSRLPTQSFSTKAASRSSQTSITTTATTRHSSHRRNISTGYGFLLT